ncbi:MAG: hypothetical protein O2925_12705 [Actinomycetota bacterium]|jgi:predicted small metal-binding protein|nr:hypothetical protein [Actinomycetota bacterium]
MAPTVKCFRGAVVQTDDEESLIAQVGDHVSSVHDMDLSREEILATANNAES